MPSTITWIRAAALAIVCNVSITQLVAQEMESDGPQVARPNLKTRTLGGKQFWSDVYWLSDWRIQQNAVTKHCRLLDPGSKRRAWGNYDACRKAFSELRAVTAIPPLKKSVVVVLHGLGRSQSSMSSVAKCLAKESDWDVANLTYASGRLSIDEHAQNLRGILAELRRERVEEIHFVAHSLGNLVVRRYFALIQNGAREKQPFCKRMVMLAPPNQGSKMAELLKKNLVFKILLGKSGQQIADFKLTESGFPRPTCEFAIIAGGRGKVAGRNPALVGDDDLVVSVEETKLTGASDFIVVPALHTFIMNDAVVQESIVRFLKNGFLESREKRNPL